MTSCLKVVACLCLAIAPVSASKEPANAIISCSPGDELCQMNQLKGLSEQSHDHIEAWSSPPEQPFLKRRSPQFLIKRNANGYQLVSNEDINDGMALKKISELGYSPEELKELLKDPLEGTTPESTHSNEESTEAGEQKNEETTEENALAKRKTFRGVQSTFQLHLTDPQTGEIVSDYGDEYVQQEPVYQLYFDSDTSNDVGIFSEVEPEQSPSRATELIRKLFKSEGQSNTEENFDNYDGNYVDNYDNENYVDNYDNGNYVDNYDNGNYLDDNFVNENNYLLSNEIQAPLRYIIDEPQTPSSRFSGKLSNSSEPAPEVQHAKFDEDKKKMVSTNDEVKIQEHNEVTRVLVDAGTHPTPGVYYLFEDNNERFVVATVENDEGSIREAVPNVINKIKKKLNINAVYNNSTHTAPPTTTSPHVMEAAPTSNHTMVHHNSTATHANHTHAANSTKKSHSNAGTRFAPSIGAGGFAILITAYYFL